MSIRKRNELVLPPINENHTRQLSDGSELSWDGAYIEPVGDRGLPRTVICRHPGDDKRPPLTLRVDIVDGAPWVTELKLTAWPGDTARIRAQAIKWGTLDLDRLVSYWLTEVSYERSGKEVEMLIWETEPANEYHPERYVAAGDHCEYVISELPGKGWHLQGGLRLSQDGLSGIDAAKQLAQTWEAEMNRVDWVKRFPVSAAERKAAAGAVEQGRRLARHRRVTPELLRQVAAAYEKALTPKHENVANTFGTTPRNAQRWIDKAREAGLLAPSKRADK